MFVKISQNSRENTCVTVSFLIKLHTCFPVNFPKYLRKSFLRNTSRRLLLVTVFSSTVVKRLKHFQKFRHSLLFSSNKMLLSSSVLHKKICKNFLVKSLYWLLNYLFLDSFHSQLWNFLKLNRTNKNWCPNVSSLGIK